MVEKLEEAAATPSPDGNLSHSINKTDSVLFCIAGRFISSLFFLKALSEKEQKKKKERRNARDFVYYVYNCFCI